VIQLAPEVLEEIDEAVAGPFGAWLLHAPTV
jgi:hypothetical protein